MEFVLNKYDAKPFRLVKALLLFVFSAPLMPVSLQSEFMVEPTLNGGNDFCVQSNTPNICKRTLHLVL